MSEGLDLPALPLGESAIADACEGLLSHYRARLDALSAQDLRGVAQARPAATAVPETLVETARGWETGGSGETLAGLASVGRTWRKLREAAHPNR